MGGLEMVTPPALPPSKEAFAVFWDCCAQIGETGFGIPIEKPVPGKENPSILEKSIGWIEENVFGVTLPPDPIESPCMAFLNLLKNQVS